MWDVSGMWFVYVLLCVGYGECNARCCVYMVWFVCGMLVRRVFMVCSVCVVYVRFVSVWCVVSVNMACVMCVW